MLTQPPKTQAASRCPRHRRYSVRNANISRSPTVQLDGKGDVHFAFLQLLVPTVTESRSLGRVLDDVLPGEVGALRRLVERAPG